MAFDTFADIKQEIERISALDERETGGVARKKLVPYNPRANMWSRFGMIPFMSLVVL